LENSPDLLLAFYTGVRMTMRAYGIKEPSLGDNKAIHLLFDVANRQDSEDDAIHFNRQVVKRIVDGLLVVTPGR
jgi:hypothetical protein